MDDNISLDSSKTVVYPFCYKIKDSCPPPAVKSIIINKPTDCLKELSDLMRLSEPYIDQNIKDKNLDKLFNCLKKYGDIYKQLGIELYVNPKTKQVTFPDNTRIQSSLNLFLRENNLDANSPKESNVFDHKLTLYNLLLNDNLRKKYNEFYYSVGFSELESIMPKEYGIARIMGQEESKGGKRKKNKRTRRKNRKIRKRKSKRKM